MRYRENSNYFTFPPIKHLFIPNLSPKSTYQTASNMDPINFCDFPDPIPYLRVAREQFIEPIDRIRFCIVCGSVSKMAYLLPCDHAMCRTCYTNTIHLENPRCPHDEIDIDIDTVIVREYNENILLRKEVRCAREGCEFRGTLESLPAHETNCISCPKCGKTVYRHNAVGHRNSELCQQEIDAMLKRVSLEPGSPAACSSSSVSTKCIDPPSLPHESLVGDVFSMLTSLSNDLNSLKDLSFSIRQSTNSSLGGTLSAIENIVESKMSAQTDELKVALSPPADYHKNMEDIKDLIEALSRKLDSIKSISIIPTSDPKAPGSDSVKRKSQNLSKYTAATGEDGNTRPIFHFDLINMESRREDYEYPERFFLLNGYLLSLKLTLTAPTAGESATGSSTPPISLLPTGPHIEITLTLSGKKRNWPKERPLMVHLLHPSDEIKNRIFAIIPKELGTKEKESNKLTSVNTGHCEIISVEAALRQGYVDNQTIAFAVENVITEK